MSSFEKGKIGVTKVHVGETQKVEDYGSSEVNFPSSAPLMKPK